MKYSHFSHQLTVHREAMSEKPYYCIPCSTYGTHVYNHLLLTTCLWLV